MEKNELSSTEDGILLYQGRIYVPADQEIRRRIMAEAHHTPYSIHPGATKMYQDLKLQFW